MSTLAPDVPTNSSPAGRCTHYLGRPRHPAWWQSPFSAAADGERRYQIAGEPFHSRDQSPCDQPVSPEWQ